MEREVFFKKNKLIKIILLGTFFIFLLTFSVPQQVSAQIMEDAARDFQNNYDTPIQAQDDGNTDKPEGKKLFGFLDTSGLTNAIVGSFASIAGSFVSFILGILVHIMSFVANFVEAIFDKVLEITVLKMGELIRGGQVKGAIETAWTSIRDIANIGLVFVLLYISVKTILRSSGHDTKKMLGSVIIAALFINFSFFIGAVIVDTSNIMALGVYEQLTTNGESLADSFSKNIGLEQMGQNFLDTLGGVKAAFTGESNLAIETAIKSVQAPFILIILLLAYIIILIIASGLLIARVVTIILLLILSPIAFAAQILPKTQKIAAEWWQSIIGQSFFIPVFLIFLLMVKDVVENGGLEFIFGEATTANQSASIINATAAGLAQTVLPGLVVLGLLAAAIIAAQKITTMGSAAVGKISGSITTKIGGAAFGAGASIGRNTVGRGFKAMEDSRWAQRMGASGRTGALALKGIRGVAGSSFDARGSKTFSGVASATGLTTKDFGKAQSGGYRKQLDNQAGARQKFADQAFTSSGVSDAEVQKKRTENDQTLQLYTQRLANAQRVGASQETIDKYTQKVAEAQKVAAKDDSGIKSMITKERKTQYAQNLQTPPSVGIPFTSIKKQLAFSGKKNKLAAEKIMYELNKGDDAKQTDKIIAAIKSMNKDS